MKTILTCFFALMIVAELSAQKEISNHQKLIERLKKCTQARVDSVFANEPNLDLRKFYKNQNKVDEERDDFTEQFKTSTSRTFDSSMTINMLAFDSLLKITRGLLKNPKVIEKAKKLKLLEDDTTFKYGYITAFRVIHGLNDEGNLTKYFEPDIILVTKDKRKVKGVTTKPLRGKPSYIYEYVDGNFERIVKDAVKDEIKKYRESVLIDRFGNNDFDNMSNGDSWKDDSEEAIFTFVEIFSIYWVNNDCDISYNGVLRLFDSSFSDKDGFLLTRFLNRKRYKHSYVFSPVTNVFREDYTPNPGDSGNLGHMCPPSCDDIEFDSGN